MSFCHHTWSGVLVPPDFVVSKFSKQFCFCVYCLFRMNFYHTHKQVYIVSTATINCGRAKKIRKCNNLSSIRDFQNGVLYYNRPFQMRAWSCITSYPLRGLPYLAYDNVNPAVVNNMMLRSSMLAFEKVYSTIQGSKRDLIPSF